MNFSDFFQNLYDVLNNLHCSPGRFIEVRVQAGCLKRQPPTWPAHQGRVGLWPCCRNKALATRLTRRTRFWCGPPHLGHAALLEK